MELSLANLANIAQIISVPLTLLVWLVTRERFAEFWKKRGKLVLAITVVLAVATLWRIGWLNWLQYQVTWPIWGLLLYPFVLLCVLVGIVALILYIDGRRNPTKQTQEHHIPPNYYTIYGARW
jgi:amino acid transporter